MTAEKQTQQTDFKQSVITYFKGVKAEWGKVSWPQKQQVIAETGIVLAVVIFFTVVTTLAYFFTRTSTFRTLIRCIRLDKKNAFS